MRAFLHKPPNDNPLVMEVGDNTLQTFVLVPPLGSSGFWSFLYLHLRDLDACEVLLHLQAVQELRNGGVRTAEHAVKIYSVITAWNSQHARISLSDRVLSLTGPPSSLTRSCHCRFRNEEQYKEAITRDRNAY